MLARMAKFVNSYADYIVIVVLPTFTTSGYMAKNL